MGNIKTSFIALFTIPASFLCAFGHQSSNPIPQTRSWYGVIGVESGIAITSDAGRSKTFPSSNNGTDEFYKYSCHHKTQAKVIYGGFVGAEWRFSPYWNCLFDVCYSQSSPFSVKGKLIQGVDVQSQDSYHYKYKILIRQLLVEGKVSYVNKTRVWPYVFLGLGPSFNRAYSFSTTVPTSLTFTRVYKNNTAAGFTYALGTGFDIKILEWFRAGIGYQFTNFGKASLGSASIDHISVSGTLSQHNFYASEVLAELIFVF